MAVKAYLKGARVSPRKLTVVAGLVRGRSVNDALVILENTPRRGAGLIRKTVVSAGANAEHNHAFKPGSLVISQISVTPGVRLKRWRSIARGVNPYQRQTSNIMVMVDGEKREIKKPVAKGESK